MATRIKLKSSVVLNKAPLSTDLEIGELAINANVGSPGAYIKDSNSNIIKIAGSGVGEIPTLQEVTDEGDVTTQEITAAKFIGNGSELTAIDLQQITTAGTVTTTGATFGGTVAANLFSGPLPYSDLTGTPTIPTNNNQLTNGAGYITSADGGNADQLDGQEGTYYLNYSNFTNTPTIPTNNNQLTNGAGYITSADGGNADQLDGQEGSYYLNYSNFTNTPTIPTNNNQLTNGAGYITSADGGDADQLDGQEGSYYLNYANFTSTPTIPTNNNQLSNGAGYVTSSGNTTIGTSTDLDTSGAEVVDQLNLTEGVITAHSKRTLTLANLGYTGATNANYITNNNQLTNGAGYYKSGDSPTFATVTATVFNLSSLPSLP